MCRKKNTCGVQTKKLCTCLKTCGNRHTHVCGEEHVCRDNIYESERMFKKCVHIGMHVRYAGRSERVTSRHIGVERLMCVKINVSVKRRRAERPVCVEIDIWIVN